MEQLCLKHDMVPPTLPAETESEESDEGDIGVSLINLVCMPCLALFPFPPPSPPFPPRSLVLLSPPPLPRGHEHLVLTQHNTLAPCLHPVLRSLLVHHARVLQPSLLSLCDATAAPHAMPHPGSH